MPNGFPSDFPVYTGARLTAAKQVLANGQTTWGVVWETLDGVDQVQSFYVSLLRHTSAPPADDGGVMFWVNSGLDLLSIRIRFEATPEFYQVWVNFNGPPS